MSDTGKTFWKCSFCGNKGYVIPEIPVECSCGEISDPVKLPRAYQGKRTFIKVPKHLRIPPEELDEFFT